MKKLLVVFCTLLCFLLCSCDNSDKAEPTTAPPTSEKEMTLSNVSIDSVIQSICSGETDVLKGFTKKDIHSSWGEPDEVIKNENAEKWNKENDYDYIVVFYGENGIVTDVGYRSVMKAEVRSDDGILLVSPCENEFERNSSDSISVSFFDNEKEREHFDSGTIILVEYDGIILESYPAQIRAYDVKKIK